jgi:cytochrome c551
MPNRVPDSRWFPLAVMLAVAGCHGGSDTSTASAPETPQLSYAQHCLGCHGQSGEGAYGPNIQGLNRTLDQIVAVVTTGRGKMPPFGGHLSTAEMRRLAEYVKTFKYKP